MTFAPIKGEREMDVSSADPISSVQQAKQAQTANNVDSAVAKKALDTQKTEGQQVVDLIQKSGSTFNAVA